MFNNQRFEFIIKCKIVLAIAISNKRINNVLFLFFTPYARYAVNYWFRQVLPSFYIPSHCNGMVVTNAYASIPRFTCRHLIGPNPSCRFRKSIDCLNKEPLFWESLKKDRSIGKYSEVQEMTSVRSLCLYTDLGST